MSSFSNDFACLTHYKTSVRGKIQDYVFNFNGQQDDLNHIVNQTNMLVEQLFSSFPNTRIFARLVAKVNFSHINPNTNEERLRSYHFPSYQSEEVEEGGDFYIRHMLKIASRLDSFNENGSNLLIKNIEHIHIHLSFSDFRQSKEVVMNKQSHG